MTTPLSRGARFAIIVVLGTWALFFAPTALIRLWLWPLEVGRVVLRMAVTP